MALLLGLGFVSEAWAVTQPPPDSTPLPQPVPAPETMVVVSRGFMPSAVTLNGLFAYRGDALDEVADAVAAPGTFRPRCETPVTIEFVLHGGSCTLALAWYNATGSTPAATDLHVMLPDTVTTEMNCGIADFCPLAGMSMYAQQTWTPRIYSADICTDPGYTGGLIGFAVVGKSTSICSQTKYTERVLNTACTQCMPASTWITALIYRSRLRGDAYYLGFEDVGYEAINWRFNSAEGDMNDLVYHVTGVCHGSDTCTTGGTGGAGGAGNGGSTNGGTAGNAGNGQGGTSQGGDSGATVGGSSNGGSSNGGSGDTGGSVSGTAGDITGAGEGGIDSGGESGSSPGTCPPGLSFPCTCSDGSDGSHMCRVDGTGYNACVCGGDDDDDSNDAGGCGCRQQRSGGAGPWALVAALLFALRRRRRAS